MDGARFTTLLEELDGAELDLTVPRWSSSSSASLVDTLTALGMTDAFDPTAADFTGMLPTAGLYVADVIHQAVIDVDEEGTEAAAATAVIFEDTASIPEDPVAVSLTRPFLYAIVDHQSRTVLFLGRLSDPS